MFQKEYLNIIFVTTIKYIQTKDLNIIGINKKYGRTIFKKRSFAGRSCSCKSGCSFSGFTSSPQSSQQVQHSPKPPIGEVVQLRKGDAWDYVRKMFDRVKPYTANLTFFQDLRVGDYEVSRAGDTLLILNESKDHLIQWTKEEFSTSFYTPIRRIDSLGSLGISSSRSSGKTKPIFSYAWRKAGKVGELEQLQVSLYDRSLEYTHANYEDCWGFRRNGSCIPLSHSINSQTPASIEGKNEILGTPIPWRINFQDVAWEVVDRSGVAEVAEALEAKFG
jgi:hypothetical protein